MVSLIGSAIPRTPIAFPFTPAHTVVWAFSCNRLASFLRSSGIMIFDSDRNFSFPTKTDFPSTLPFTPPPVMDWKSLTSSNSIPSLFAAFTIACASGCSLRDSTDAAICKRSRSFAPFATTLLTTSGLPAVSVPVLSVTTCVTFSAISIASAFLIRTPACAARPTPTMIDIGVANPSAHGHAMIRTETALTKA